MLVARRRSTGAWINDLQQKATYEVLLRNAVASGIPSHDVEVVEVDSVQYAQIDEELNAAARAAALLAVAAEEAEEATIKSVLLNKLGLTEEAQLKAVARLLKKLVR